MQFSAVSFFWKKSWRCKHLHSLENHPILKNSCLSLIPTFLFTKCSDLGDQWHFSLWMLKLVRKNDKLAPEYILPPCNERRQIKQTTNTSFWRSPLYLPIFHKHSVYVSRKLKLYHQESLCLIYSLILPQMVLSNKWAMAYIILYISVVYSHYL